MGRRRTPPAPEEKRRGDKEEGRDLKWAGIGASI
jgi:hypothetical protein